MGFYIVRRLFLIIPTLFGIMVLNFLIVQTAPGGPVEQIVAELMGDNTDATDRITQSGGEMGNAADEASYQGYEGTRGSGPRLHKGVGKAVRIRQTPARTFF